VAVKPVYKTAEPNDGINVGRLKASLPVGNTPKELDFEAKLRMLPVPSLVLETQVDVVDAFKLSFSLYQDPARVIEFADSGTKAEVHLLSTENNRVAISPRREPLVIGDPKAKLKRVVFHVLNFWVFDSNWKAHIPSTDRELADHVELVGDKHKITISSLVETRELVKGLRKTSGFGITHCGEIVATGSGDLSVKEVSALLDELHFYLSFARGIRVGIILPVGYDSDGKQVYQEWGARLCSPWRYVLAWMNPRRGEALEEAFPGFHQMWSQETWHDALRDAIIWYCTANAPGVELDTGIVLAQAALELLAWTYAVHDKKLFTAKSFKKKRGTAAKKIETILDGLNLDNTIPAECADLLALARKHSWPNGPQALTSVRNDIVHPKKDLDPLTHDAAYQTRELALRYVELILLKLFGYSGDYCTRLSQPFVGETKKVPWAT